MKNSFFLFVLVLSFLGCSNFDTSEKKLVLWYKQPAINWESEALPIGNGRFGGMFFGGVEKDRLQFNDLTLWEGSPEERGSYQNFGDIYFYFDHYEPVGKYRRELDLENAIGRVFYEKDGVKYIREYFSSSPDSAIIMRFAADKKGKINMSVALHDAHQGEKSIASNAIAIQGKLSLLSYYAQLKIFNKGGEVKQVGDSLVITNANEVLAILAGSTDYDPVNPDFLRRDDLADRVSSYIDKAGNKDYKLLQKSHIEEYQSLFNRVKLDLGGELLTRPTDSVLADYKRGIYNVTLENIYFQYGRYLMISCSRPGLALPSNLQGIWCNSNKPPWQSDIHSNINVQMNYWPAEVTNLSECHLPYLDYIYNHAAIHPYWTNYAKELGHRGWTMKTENNIFGLSGWKWNCPSNAWYSMHIWQHYAYTLDTVYLKTRAYPIMKTACEFWIDRLIKDKDGKWVAPNEWSPEHGPWEEGPAYAQQLIWDLFANTMKAASVLQISDDFTDTLVMKYDHLDDGLAIGEWGQLKEWKTTEDDPEDKHRHISHMIGLFPGKQIFPVIDTLYANAAKISLNARGDKTTGWATTHRINAWAKLHDGDRALSIFRNYLLGGMTLDNLFDTHPPFQIDGNFGGTAGVATMLLQSFDEKIYLLPALPTAWSKGSITGLTAERGFEIDITWNNKKPVEVKVKSKFGLPCKLVMKDFDKIEVYDQQNNPVDIIIGDEGEVGFDTKSEGIYDVKIL